MVQFLRMGVSSVSGRSTGPQFPQLASDSEPAASAKSLRLEAARQAARPDSPHTRPTCHCITHSTHIGPKRRLSPDPPSSQRSLSDHAAPACALALCVLLKLITAVLVRPRSTCLPPQAPHVTPHKNFCEKLLPAWEWGCMVSDYAPLVLPFGALGSSTRLSFLSLSPPSTFATCRFLGCARAPPPPPPNPALA